MTMKARRRIQHVLLLMLLCYVILSIWTFHFPPNPDDDVLVRELKQHFQQDNFKDRSNQHGQIIEQNAMTTSTTTTTTLSHANDNFLSRRNDTTVNFMPETSSSTTKVVLSHSPHGGGASSNIPPSSSEGGHTPSLWEDVPHPNHNIVVFFTMWQYRRKSSRKKVR